MATLKNLHLPSRFDSEQSEASTSKGTISPREHALQLTQRKKEIEDDIASYIDILKSHNADFSTQLVDREGFPRGDIDVAAIRTARARLIMLRNDLSQVTNNIAKALEDVYADPSSFPPVSSFAPAQTVEEDALKPFAMVNSVAEGSPAQQAGLLQGDYLLKFGNISTDNSDKLRALPPLVASMENRPIMLLIRRNAQDIDMSLVPRKHNGRGLLGCHIVPV